MAEITSPYIKSKTFNCENLFNVLVQFPSELDEIKNQEHSTETIVRKPITCVISNKEIVHIGSENADANDTVAKIAEAKENIIAIYYVTPNPKRIGGVDYLQTTLLESHEDKVFRNLGLKLSLLIFNHIGLGKTPVYVYLTSDLRQEIQWEGDILKVLTAFKEHVKV